MLQANTVTARKILAACLGGFVLAGPPAGLAMSPPSTAHAGGTLPASMAASASSKPDVDVAIRDAGTAANGGVAGVALQGEVTNEPAAQSLGYRSMTSIVDVDCASRRHRVLQLQEYEGHNLTGAERVLIQNGQWARPPTRDYMSSVISTLCGSKPGMTASSSPRLTTSAAAPPSQAAAPTTAAAAASGTTSSPALAQAERAAPGRLVALQVGAFRTDLAARDRLRRTEPLPPGLGAQVRPMLVGDTHYYRALVIGFASRSEAATYCADQHLPHAACWIH